MVNSSSKVPHMELVRMWQNFVSCSPACQAGLEKIMILNKKSKKSDFFLDLKFLIKNRKNQIFLDLNQISFI